MYHEYCEKCEGWYSYPIGEKSPHRCGITEVSNPVVFIGGDDWFTDDSDY